MKKVPKKVAEEFISEVEREGLSYWLLDYTRENYVGTELQLLIDNARIHLELLQDKIDELTEKYNLEGV